MPDVIAQLVAECLSCEGIHPSSLDGAQAWVRIENVVRGLPTNHQFVQYYWSSPRQATPEFVDAYNARYRRGHS